MACACVFVCVGAVVQCGVHTVLQHFNCSSPEDAEELVDLRVAGPQRAAVHHLDEDRADRPHVDGGRVRALAEQDLGCAVPERDDLCGRAVRMGCQRSRNIKHNT